MTNLKSERDKIHVDDKGYLADFETWNEDVALVLAREEGITSLSKGQLEIIRELRTYLRIPVASGHLFRCKVGHLFRSNLGQAFRCKVVH